MKKSLLILLIVFPLSLSAQTDRELLLELVKQHAETNKQIAETNKQIAEVYKQQAITSTKVDGFEKAVSIRFDDANKRIDILVYTALGIGGVLFAGIFGLIGVIFWDRRATAKPFETKTLALKKEINLLKERETKLEERETRLEEKQLKNESILKKLIEKYPDLAGV